MPSWRRRDDGEGEPSRSGRGCWWHQATPRAHTLASGDQVGAITRPGSQSGGVAVTRSGSAERGADTRRGEGDGSLRHEGKGLGVSRVSSGVLDDGGTAPGIGQALPRPAPNPGCAACEQVYYFLGAVSSGDADIRT